MGGLLEPLMRCCRRPPGPVSKAALRGLISPDFASSVGYRTRSSATHWDVLGATRGRRNPLSATVARDPPVYALTRICSVEYTKRVESVFEVIAEPNRRAILSLLVSSQQSVGEIERQLGMPQPTVFKHLRALREADFVESTVDAGAPPLPVET